MIRETLDPLILVVGMLLFACSTIYYAARAGTLAQRVRDLESVVESMRRRLPLRTITPAPCRHERTDDVTTRQGILVARLCLDCDRQLEVDR